MTALAETVGDPVATGGAVGRRVPARANRQLAAGRGQFIDDIAFTGLTHIAFVRSPYAHARILGIDATAALARPGVLLVLTGRDVLGTLRPIPSGADNSAMGARSVPWRALVPDRVRYVGELVAAVVAEDRWTARAALDDVVVDYEELPAVADPYEALEPGAPLVEPEWGDNVILRRSFQSGDADAALAVAGRRASGTLACGRLADSPIEPAAASRRMTQRRGASITGTPRSSRMSFGRSSPRRWGCRRARSVSSSPMSGARSASSSRSTRSRRRWRRPAGGWDDP